METLKEISTWLAIIGMPTIFGLTAWCVKACIKFFKKLDILEEAQKAQMRAQLMDKYYVIKERGYAWSDEVDEWVNQYNAYHVLKGPNDVLDARKTEILNIQAKVR